MNPMTTSTFRGVTRSTFLESFARHLGDRLQHCYQRISGCDFTIVGTLSEPIQATHFFVKLHLSLPDAEIHADSELDHGALQINAQEALRAAFKNARRQLDDLERRRVLPLGCISSAYITRACAVG
jgi:hypothetical protein